MMMGMITGAAGERAFMDTWDGHGYGVLEVGQDEARLSYRAVDKLHAKAGVSTSYQVRTARGSSTLDVL